MVREVISRRNDKSLTDFKLGSNVIKFTLKQNNAVCRVANGLEGVTVDAGRKLGGFVAAQAKEDGGPRWVR